MENDDAHLGRKSIAGHSERSQNNEAQPSTSLFTGDKKKKPAEDNRCYSLRIQNQILAKAQQNKNTSGTQKGFHEATQTKAAKRGRKAQHPLNRRDGLSLWRVPGRSNVFTVIGKPNNGFFPLSYSEVAAERGVSNTMQTAPYPSAVKHPENMQNPQNKPKIAVKAIPGNPKKEPPASTTTGEGSTTTGEVSASTSEAVPSIKKVKKDNEWTKVTKRMKKPKNIKTEDSAKTHPKTKDNGGTKLTNKKKKPKNIKTENTAIMNPGPRSEILSKKASQVDPEVDANIIRGRTSIEECSKRLLNNKAQHSTSLFTDDKNKNTGQESRCYSLRIQNQILTKAQQNKTTSSTHKASPGKPEEEPPASTTTAEVVPSVKNIKKENGWTKVTKKKTKKPTNVKTEDKPIILTYPEPRIIVKAPTPNIPVFHSNKSRVSAGST